MDPNRERRNFDEMPAMPTRDDGPGWAIPMAIGAVVLVAGLIIFNAAGPERTRTAGMDNPATTQPATQSRPASPPQRDGSATPAATPAPQKPNPAGTQ
jgi:hypothetical protein